MGNNDLSIAGMEKVHASQNSKKYSEYWAGFLYGILSSGKIESQEVEPLKVVCKDFVEQFDDADASDLLQDLDLWPENTGELKLFIKDIISDHLGDVDVLINSRRFPRNAFYGFAKGIACDNQIHLKELQSLIELGHANTELLASDPRVVKVIRYAQLAIKDLNVSRDENDEICEYISRIVGDSYADTGVGLPSDMPQLEGTVIHFDQLQFENKNFVLTGSFDVPKREYSAAITKLGGNIQSSVTKDTDYLILASAGSRYYNTPNAGTKIGRAVQIRAKYGKLAFVNERTIEPILEYGS